MLPFHLKPSTHRATQFFKVDMRVDGKEVTLDLAGELTIAATDILEAVFSEVKTSKTQTVVLNFSDVAYINSSGIALIIRLLARAQQIPCTLMAYGLRPFYEELFKLAGLTDYLPILSAEGSL